MVTELRCKYLSSVFQILIYNLSFNHNLHWTSRFTHADVDSIRCVRVVWDCPMSTLPTSQSLICLSKEQTLWSASAKIGDNFSRLNVCVWLKGLWGHIFQLTPVQTVPLVSIWRRQALNTMGVHGLLKRMANKVGVGKSMLQDVSTSLTCIRDLLDTRYVNTEWGEC